MKQFIKVLSLLILPIASYTANDNFNEITYKHLGKEVQGKEFCVHDLHLYPLFKELNIRTALEFGISSATQFLLDSSNKVISVETLSPGHDTRFMQYYLYLYKKYSNWIPIAYLTNYEEDVSWAPYIYRGSENVYRALSYQVASHKSYAHINDLYRSELNSFTALLCKTNQIDLALVHGVNYLRGDLVQILFGKVPIIIAHNTSEYFEETSDDLFGYSRILAPGNYTKIFLDLEEGTTLWIENKPEFFSLIRNMKNFAKQLKGKK